MKNIIKVLASCILFVLPLSIRAQNAEMADEMRTNGKIYVVVAVIVTILLGLIVFLVMTDRKVSKLEKDILNNR